MPVSLLQPVTKRSICGSRMHYFKHHLRLDPLLHGIDQSDDSPRSKAEPVTSRGSGSYAILRPFDGLKQTERERENPIRFTVLFSFFLFNKYTKNNNNRTHKNSNKQSNNNKKNETQKQHNKTAEAKADGVLYLIFHRLTVV